MAVWLVQVTVAWSQLEQALGHALAHILNSQPRLGIEVYLSLEHNSAQLKVVRDTAALVMDEADFGIFEAILVLVRRAGRFRNIVAHGTWGVAEKIPNGLLLFQGKEASKILAPLFAAGMSPSQTFRRNDPDAKVPEKLYEIMEDTLVYFDSEFIETRNLITSIIVFLSEFWEMRRSSGVERETLRRKLCDEPAIQEALCRQSKDR